MTINNYIEKLGLLPHPEAFEAYEATFFDSLPSEFNRRTYLSIAERHHVAPKTAEKYIRKFCTTGQLKHLAHDSYSKM